jgi:hypothetical protein
MLKYPGHVHVRDLALMLEEVLYFYRPDGELLVPLELEFVFGEYDKWVTKHAVPIADEVLAAVSNLVALSADGTESAQTPEQTGFYQQQKLVTTAHFGALALPIARAGIKAGTPHPPASPPLHSPRAPPSPLRSPSAKTELGRHTCKWSDIRLLMDRHEHHARGHNPPHPSDAVSSPTHGAQLASVAARSAAKRQKLNALHIAHASVPFHKFARWVYVVLKSVAENRKDELEFHMELTLQHKSTRGAEGKICSGCSLLMISRANC